MSETVRRMLRLSFPRHLGSEPILFEMARDHDLVPTVRRAHLGQEGGEVLLQVEGSEENVEKGIEYLRAKGVAVTPADKDVGGRR